MLPLVAGLASHGQVSHFKSQHNGPKKLLSTQGLIYIRILLYGWQAVKTRFVVGASVCAVFVVQGKRVITHTFKLDSTHADEMATRAMYLRRHGAKAATRGASSNKTKPAVLFRNNSA
jgi:hypothetical protein